MLIQFIALVLTMQTCIDIEHDFDCATAETECSAADFSDEYCSQNRLACEENFVESCTQAINKTSSDVSYNITSP